MMLSQCKNAHFLFTSIKPFSSVLSRKLSTENLWEQTWDQIRNKVGDGKQVHLIYPTIDWNWRKAGVGLIEAEVYNLVDTIPAWSGIGKYNPSSTSLHQQYKQMLEECPNLVPTPEQQKQLDEVEDQINELERQLNAKEQQKEVAWANHIRFASDKTDDAKTKWEKEKGWTKRFEADKEMIDKLTDTKTSIQNQQPRGHNELMIKAAEYPKTDNEIKPGFVHCNIGGNLEWRPNYLVKDGQDWVKDMTRGGGNPLSIKLQSSKASAKSSSSYSDIKAFRGFPFFGVGAAGKMKDIQLGGKADEVSIEINIKAFTQVPVRPDKWFNSGYLKILKERNKWNPPYTSQGGDSPVFGEKGLLPLMVTGLIAGYQPSFTMTTKSAEFKRHATEIQGGAGFSIGPFRFGGEAGHSNDKVEVSKDGQTISGKSEATYPFIMGFTVASPGLE